MDRAQEMEFYKTLFKQGDWDSITWLEQPKWEIVSLRSLTLDETIKIVVPMANPNVRTKKLIDFVHEVLPQYPRGDVPPVRLFEQRQLDTLIANAAGLLMHDLREIWLRDDDDMRTKGVFVHEYVHYVQSAALDWQTTRIFGSMETVFQAEIEAHTVEQQWYDSHWPQGRKFADIAAIEPYVRQRYIEVATDMVDATMALIAKEAKS